LKCDCAYVGGNASFLPWWDDVIRNVLVLVQEGKLTCASFPPWWDDVVRDVLVLLQKGKLVCVSFPPRWDDVV
jgi:hypothetical protein